MTSVKDYLPPPLRKFLGRVKARFFRSLVPFKWLLLDSVRAVTHFARALPATLGIHREETRSARVPRWHDYFHQGLELGRRRGRILGWNLFHHHRLVVVVLHPSDDAALHAWLRRAHRLLGNQVLAERSASGALVPHAVELTGGAPLLRREILRHFPQHDAVLIDAREPLPSHEDLINLKYAAHRFAKGRRIGMAVPARIDADGGVRLGVDFDRASGTWREIRMSDVRDYGQDGVPRYVLTDRAHGAYLRHEFISLVTTPPHPADHDELVAGWIAAGWIVGSRTLLHPTALMETRRPFTPPPGLIPGWLSDRRIVGPDGRIRVIFVLQATTLSGGIRAVMELAEGLAKRGLDVQIWSLQGRPTWTDIELDVVKFRTYDALIDALEPENALKVATWWETGIPVWLASVNNGIPLHYVQEFETWFYPESAGGRAAVASGYRHEFEYVTTAAFQRDELAEVGIETTIIPPAFHAEVFRERPEIARADDRMLAVGRSFFQKNFAMTIDAWRSLGDERPPLDLFGFEPKIATDARITYHYLPSDDEVARLYNAAGCFVQTSLHEGFSLPIIEAMASGCPVITTDSHGNRFCVDGENAIMVEQGDVAGLAAAITRVLGDAELRDRLRAGGLETASRFTWDTVVDQTVAHYTALAKRTVDA